MAFLTSSACFALEPYGRMSVGYNNTFNLGAGCFFSDNLSAGLEFDGWSDVCGLVCGVDGRYRFGQAEIRPVADVMIGYGLLGKTYEYEDYFNFAGRTMFGLNWKTLDLCAGFVYDSFYGLHAAVSLSFTFRVGKRA